MDTKDIKQAEGDGHDVPFKWWIGAIIGVVVLWVLSAILISAFSTERFSMGERGTFGDMFGAVNALFSGLAFATLIYTVLQQRAELRATRAEMKQQSLEWAKQNEVLSLQAFEGSFFQMLRMLDEAAKSSYIIVIDTQPPFAKRKRVGDAGFHSVIHDVVYRWHQMRNLPEHSGRSGEDLMGETVTEYLARANDGFFRYLGAFTNVVKFVADSEVKDRSFYSSLLRSQMSTEQLTFVFYAQLSLNASETLKSSLKSLKFLDDLPVNLFNPQSRVAAYGEGNTSK